MMPNFVAELLQDNNYMWYVFRYILKYVLNANPLRYKK